LNAKLARVQVAPVVYSVAGHVDRPAADDATRLVRYLHLDVEAPVPSHSQWEFVAVLVHTDEGNILRTVPGFTLPPEVRDRPNFCDHCQTKRVRNDTYIVRHTVDGRIMQVGSSCLQEFLGTATTLMTKVVESLLNVYSVCEAAQHQEWLRGSRNNPRAVYRIDLETYLTYVATKTLQAGKFVTRKLAQAEGLESTASAALAAMDGRHECEVSDEARTLAQKARQWVLMRYSPVLLEADELTSADDCKMAVLNSFRGVNKQLGDFEHNLLSCARADAIESRLCGVAAYIIEAYRRDTGKSAPAKPTVDLTGLLRIHAMFDTAEKSQLKYPVIRLQENAESRCLSLSKAAATSNNAGCLYVKDTISKAYYGKITPQGRFFGVAACSSTVEQQLQRFAANPEELASRYGKLTGRCCFCGRSLDDERSTEVGYGPVCAEKFGLKWGRRPEAVEAVAA